MAIMYEVTNKIRGVSSIRIHGVGTANLNTQAELTSTNTTENITGYQIKKCAWSTNGSIMIVQGGQDVLELQGQGQINFDADFANIANTAVPLVANRFLAVTIATGGTCMLSVAKEANYVPSLINTTEEI